MKGPRDQKSAKIKANQNCSKPDTGVARIQGFGNDGTGSRTVRKAQAQDDQARLEPLLLEGLNSKDVEVSDNFWKELKAEAKALVKKHSGRKAKSAA